KLLNRKPQPIDYARSFSAPLLVLHGTEDEVFPQDIGKRLFGAAGSKDKFFVSLPGTGHSNVNISSGPAKEALDAFFAKYGGSKKKAIISVFTAGLLCYD
ncbi:MAG TPA: alpha/beta hydrolase, partial [Candidatus Goldiibacteriota bacterium]|nr:alpha/beta hydrolase [Candidatus Goldiibacteriota bacterium]